MRNLILLILAFSIHTSFAQIVVNGKDINELKPGTHIQMRAQEFKAKLTVTVDYGQENDFDGRKINRFTVDDGPKKKIFKSSVDALNFFLNNGWEFVDFSVATNESIVYTYLLKRQSQ